MAESVMGTISVPNPAGGISQQPPPQRFAGQAEADDNVVVSLADGTSKRSGTRYIARLTSLVAGTAYRLHPIDRSPTERYLVVHGPPSAYPGNYLFRVYHSDGTAATVTISSDAQTYLSSGSPTSDDIVLKTVQDTTFVVNRNVATATGSSTSYAVSGSARDTAVLFSRQPTNSTYWRTEQDDEVEAKGYWYYVATDSDSPPAPTIFAKWTGATLSGSSWHTIGKYQANPNDSGAWRMFFQRFSTGGSITATYSGMTLTNAAFSSYTVSGTEHLHVTATTNNWVVGYYRIASKSGNDVTLASLTPVGGTSAAAPTGSATCDGIGIGVQASANFQGRALSTMDDVALVFQDALRDAGCADALCAWEWVTASTGRFVVVSPFGTSSATVKTPLAPLGGVADYTDSGDPFAVGAGVPAVGSGGSVGTLTPLKDRWIKVAAPNQANAKITNTTMPMLLRRTVVGPPATFTLDVATWTDRLSGDEDSNPVPEALDGQYIADITLHANRLCILAGPWLVMSSADDLYNFYVDDAANIVESDPIILPLGDEQPVNGMRLHAIRKTLMIFAEGGRQFEMYAEGALTPTTATITPSTNHQALDVRPSAMGTSAYFLASFHDRTTLMEYPYADGQVATRADDLTTWVPAMLPASCRGLAADPLSGVVAVLPGNDEYLYFYKAGYSGERKEQSAWVKHTFDSSYDIRDVAFLGGEFYLFVESQSQFIIEKMAPDRARADTGYNYTVHLDRLINGSACTRAVVSSKTRFTLPSSLSDTTINCVVTAAGIIYTGTSNGTQFTTTDNVDLTATTCIVGRTFTSRMTPTRLFRRREDGSAILTDRILVMGVAVYHKNTGAYGVRVVIPQRTDRTVSFSHTAGAIQSYGRLDTTICGEADNMTIHIEDSTARPMTISAIEYTVQVVPDSAGSAV